MTITVSSFNTVTRNRIGGGRWDTTGEREVLLVDGLPVGVAVFAANGSRRQRCAVCAASFRQHGYIAVRGGQWRPCCSDACLDAQLAKLGLTVAHVHAGSAPADWTDFDGLAVSAPEMTGARIDRDGDAWSREPGSQYLMPNRELQSLARDWTERDRRAVLARAEAEQLAAMGVDTLIELLAVLGREHREAVRARRELARAYRAARTAAARAEIAAKGKLAAAKITETLAQFKATFAALEIAEGRDADRREFVSAREDFLLELEGVDERVEEEFALLEA